MIRMQLAQRYDGVDLAHAIVEGREIQASSRNGVTMKLARELMAAGVPDQPWEAYGGDGRLRMFGPSLYGWAKWTMTEGEHRMKRVRFTPNTRFHRIQDAPDGFSDAAGSPGPDDRESPPAHTDADIR